MNAHLLFTAVLASWFLVTGCQRQPDPTVNLPLYSLHLANRLTGDPVANASVRPYCGIPGDTNDYRSDFQGLVKVRSWLANGGTFLSIRAKGYSPTAISVLLTNQVTTILLDKVSS